MTLYICSLENQSKSFKNNMISTKHFLNVAVKKLRSRVLIIVNRENNSLMQSSKSSVKHYNYEIFLRSALVSIKMFLKETYKVITMKYFIAKRMS